MKNFLKSFLFFLLLFGLVSCQNEQEKKTEQLTSDYVRFVDSVTNVSADKAIENFEDIDIFFDKKLNQLQKEIDKLDEKVALEERANNATEKYDDFKKFIIEKKVLLDIENDDVKIKKELFGADFVNDNMKFKWVNKDNILNVYNQFITTVTKNKEAFKNEDWIEIKALYDALNIRKLTVEKQGLNVEENNKIAMLKLKFAPIIESQKLVAI